MEEYFKQQKRMNQLYDVITVLGVTLSLLVIIARIAILVME